MRTRAGRPGDAEAIARIYNEGIEDRLATFETEPRSPADVRAWLAGSVPFVVVEDEAGTVAGWASASEYRPRRAYSGVREFSIYVAREARGRGLGRAALQSLIDECERRGVWKLVSRVFPENEASLALCRSLASERWRLPAARQAGRGVARRGDRGAPPRRGRRGLLAQLNPPKVQGISDLDFRRH